MFEEGPYLSMAVLCEKALQEKDGVISAIRIIDRYMIARSGVEAPETLPRVDIALVAIIAFKSGKARGSHTIGLRPENPSGLKKDTISLPVLFEGEDRGAGIVLNVNLTPEEEGLYWFDVLMDNTIVSRIPLRVVYQRFGVGGPSK